MVDNSQRATAPVSLAETPERAEPMDHHGLTPEHVGVPSDIRQTLVDAVMGHAAELQALSHALHDHPELSHEEHASVRKAADLVRAHGHEVEVGAYGMPTAMRSVTGQRGPRVGILAEYDALPGIGHGCGHNVICSSAVGAFLALSTVVETLGGSVELIGTPAEEGGGGKEHIARAGGFKDLDVAMMIHPADEDSLDAPFLGLRSVQATYHGVAAHASSKAFMGRNALDGIVAAYNGIAALRQHMRPTDRVHGVITDGGAKANIVPDRAAGEFFVRSADLETLADLSGRVHAIFEGAASITGTTVEVEWDTSPAYLPVRHNKTLAERYASHAADRGRKPSWAERTQSTAAGSTDFGNVSVRVPGIHPKIAIADRPVPGHSEEFARCARSPEADAAVIDGAICLALTGADFLADAQLRQAVRGEFLSAGGYVEVEQLFR